MTDFPDWQSPQAHATAISITGAPLLNLHNDLINQAGTIAAGNTILTIPDVGFAQPGWEALVQLEMPNTATKPYPRVTFIWKDLALGTFIWQDAWHMMAGNILAGNNVYQGRGPTLGNRLGVTIENFDPAQILTYNIQVWQTSQLPARADFRQDDQGGFTQAGAINAVPTITDMVNNIIGAQRSAALGAGNAVTTVLPLFAGRARFAANISSANNLLGVTLLILGNTAINNVPFNAGIWYGKSDALGNINTDFVLPRAHCGVLFQNNDTVARQVIWTVTAAEY